MKRFITQGVFVGVCMLALAGCGALLVNDDQSGGNVATDATTKFDKSRARLAPELQSAVWLNGAPTSLKELRGQVVLVDFWTFG